MVMAVPDERQKFYCAQSHLFGVGYMNVIAAHFSYYEVLCCTWVVLINVIVIEGANKCLAIYFSYPVIVIKMSSYISVGQSWISQETLACQMLVKLVCVKPYEMLLA